MPDNHATPHSGVIHPANTEWQVFHDPHGRPTTPVRILKADNPYILEADFPPDFYAGDHWHPYDTLYIFRDGAMRIGAEGNFFPGDIRWVKAGQVYGPEHASDQGVRFFLISLGGEIGLNWADLHDVPQDLADRLATFESPWGRARLGHIPVEPFPDPAGVLSCDTRVVSERHPSIYALTLAPGQGIPAFRAEAGRLLWLVTDGTLQLGTERRMETEDLFWQQQGAACPGLSAGPDGATVLLFGLDGEIALNWS